MKPHTSKELKQAIKELERDRQAIFRAVVAIQYEINLAKSQLVAALKTEKARKKTPKD
jgi:hypothetical protein